MRTIGEKIRTIRKYKKWTQKDLADIMNVSESTVQKWEVGKNKLSIADVKRISKAFDVYPSVLFDDSYFVNVIQDANKSELKISKEILEGSSKIEKLEISSNSVLYRFITEDGDECSAIFKNGSACILCRRQYEDLILKVWKQMNH